MLADGSFAVASNRLDLGTFEVQFFDAESNVIPPTLFVPPVGSSEGTLGVLVGSLGENYILIRQDFDGLEEPASGAYAQLYSARGSAVGPQFLWPASDLPNFGDFYRFGSAPLWRFLPITYKYLPDIGPGQIFRTSLRLGEPNPLPQLPPIQIGAPKVRNIEDAAINGHGQFVVDSFECVSYPPPSPPCTRGIQIFDGATRPLTPFRTGDVTQDELAVFTAIDGKGHVLLHFLNSDHRPVVRLYDAGASPASLQIPLDTLGLPYENYVGLQGLDDDSFLLAFTVTDPQGSSSFGEDLLLTRFDAQARRFDRPIVVATARYAFRKVKMDVNGDGKGVIVWETEGIDAFGTTAGYFCLLRAER
jgi:hypothetical protein